MSEVLKANLFFFITAAAVIIIGIAVAVFLVYVIRILRDVKKISEDVKDVTEQIKTESRLIARDIDEFRLKMRAQGSILKWLTALTGIFKRHKKNSKRPKG